MIAFLKQKKDLLVVFFISFFLFLPYTVDICSGYLKYNLTDLQSFLLWDYSLIKRLIIYKDLTYPYGIFQYYSKSNIPILFLYYLVAPLNFTLIFYACKKVFTKKIILYTFFILFYLFIFEITGFTVFTRYGLFISLSLIFSIVLFYKKEKSVFSFLLIGIISGVVFFIANDQGLYLGILFLTLFAVNEILNVKKKKLFSVEYHTYIVKQIAVLFLGFFVGTFPLVLFLIKNNSVNDFFIYFKDINNVVIVAKTPFFNFIITRDNLFTISAIYLAIFLLLIKILFRKSKNVITLMQMALVLDILIMEQKSIVRSISTQITFISFLLVGLIFFDLVGDKAFKTASKNIKNIFFATSILIVIFAFQLTPVYKNNYSFQTINRNLRLLTNNKCYDANLNLFLKRNPEYLDIFTFFRSKVNYADEIFVFPPGDSIFYILFNKIPPYYDSIWNSSVDNLNNQITYLKKNKVRYVLLNMMSFVNDGIPDYMRLPILYKYILNNYYPVYNVKNYLILEAAENKDFFNSVIPGQTFMSNLLNPDFGKIPLSEGLYKYDLLKRNAEILIKSKDIYIINEYLKNNIVSSRNIVMVITSASNSDILNSETLEIKVDKMFTTYISYDNVSSGKKYILNLTNVPLFYKDRTITKLSLKNNSGTEFEIFKLTGDANSLW